MRLPLTLVLTLLVCIQVFGQQAETKYTVFQDEQFPYSIKYPDSWIKIAPSDPQVRFRILNNLGHGTAQIGITVAYRKQNEQFAPGEYVSGIIERPQLIQAIISQSMGDAKILSSGKTFLSNQEAFFVRSEGVIKSLDQVSEIEQYQVIMLLEGNQYILHFADTKANFDKDFPEFESIVSTFSVRPVKTGLKILAYANNVKNDRWHDLIIDVSVPDDAIIILGIPDSDESTNLPISKIDKWLTDDIHSKKYRRLGYTKVEGYEDVILVFSANRLVFIQLVPRMTPQSLSPDALKSIYGTQFRPVPENFDEITNSQDFENASKEKPTKRYASAYDLIGLAERTFLIAGIINNDPSEKEQNYYPGKVKQIQIVSRSLQK